MKAPVIITVTGEVEVTVQIAAALTETEQLLRVVPVTSVGNMIYNFPLAGMVLTGVMVSV